MNSVTGFTELTHLAQAGGMAILLVAVWQLWTRLNVLTDHFLRYMEERADEGDVAAQNVVQDHGTTETNRRS